MRLKLQTDYALRVLLYLGYAGGGASVADIAHAFRISHDHLVKVVQALAGQGWVTTRAGRGGGMSLAVDLDGLSVAEVVAAFEGRKQVLECLLRPEVCVLEPGCELKRLLSRAEAAFFDTLAEVSLGSLCLQRGKGGLRHLDHAIQENRP